MKISSKISKVNPSLTLAISAKAKAMKKEGKDVVGFGAGEPDFDTPDHIKEAAIKSIKGGFTKYTPTSGTPELKEAICKKLEKENNLKYSPSQIIISCGAKHSIFNIIQVICDEGDEVIIPSPYWLSYPEMVTVAGGKSVFLETTLKNEYKFTLDQLKKAITPKTVGLILNSPSNPTGSVYTPDEIKEIAKFLEDKNIVVISDEIYERLLYDGAEQYSIAQYSEKMKSKTVVVNGVSKTYSMTGWRIGYAAAPEEIVKAASKLQDHSTSNPTSFCQVASQEAILGDQSSVEKMRQAFDERRKYMVEKVNSIPGLSCINPKGAFYCFVCFKDLIGKTFSGKKINGSMDITDYLLDTVQVAVVPGKAFGADDHFRLSYATSMENIKKGLDRIEKALKY